MRSNRPAKKQFNNHKKPFKMPSIYSSNILTPAASAADVILSNSLIRITGAPAVNIKEATLSQFNDPITEMRDQWVLTPTQATASGQVYSFVVTQFVRPLGRTVIKTFSYTSTGASDTATIISNRLRAIIVADLELALTVTGGATLTILANTNSSDLNITLIQTGAGLTTSNAVVNTAGSTVTISNATALAQAGTGVAGVVTVTANSTNLAAGMLVNYTLSGTDSITLADGTVLASGAVLPVRVANVSGTAFDFGPSTDSNIESITIGATGARTLTVSPAYPRGSAVEVASRGITGTVAGTVYGEVRINWLETPANGGGPAIARTHSVFVDSTTNATNYANFRTRALNAMRGVAATTFTAAVDSTSIN